MSQDIFYTVAIVLVAIGGFCVGRLTQFADDSKKKVSALVIGGTYALKRADPWSEPAITRILEIKDGWVRYEFAKYPNTTNALKADTFAAIYTPFAF